MKKSAKKSLPQNRCKAPAKRPQKGGTPGASGKLSREEITNLVLQAREAFDLQAKLGRIEPGQSFDDWRREQVQDVAQVAGISKLQRAQWRAVKAHFLALSGREDEALALALTTGTKTYRPTSPLDTWEASETYVAHMRAALDAHARSSVTDPRGHIHAGWLIAAARQRTGKPSLSIATLAERLDPPTLHGLLSHLVNHIALREGRADLTRRTPRGYPKKPDPGDFSDFCG